VHTYREIEHNVFMRNLVEGSEEYELYHAREDALKAQKEADALMRSLEVCDGSASCIYLLYNMCVSFHCVMVVMECLSVCPCDVCVFLVVIVVLFVEQT
jgi:hypothetical protein